MIQIGDIRVRPCVDTHKETGARVYHWVVVSPAALDPRQIERIRLGALKSTIDRWRSLPPGQRKDEGRELIRALEAKRIRNDVVGPRGNGQGDIVLYEATDRSDVDKPSFSFPSSVLARA